MALEGVFGNIGGKRKRKGFLGLFCGMGERSPHTHDTNMEGRERTWRERRKEQGKGKERKYAKTFQSSPRLAYVRYMYV